MSEKILPFFLFRRPVFFPFFFCGLLFVLNTAHAQCPRFAAAGEFPTAGEVICNDNFAIGYSNSRRSPLWAAERLTAEQNKASQSLKEAPPPVSNDPRVNQSISPEDYQTGNWKPLFLACPEDMSTGKAKKQSAFISNIIPGNPALQQKAWKKIEENTRKMIGEYGTFNVLTGVIFGDSSQSFGKNHARLPDKIWKIIYVPRQGTAAVICNNSEPLHCTATTVQEIENLSYIGLFPGVSESETHKELHPAHWPGL